MLTIENGQVYGDFVVIGELSRGRRRCGQVYRRILCRCCCGENKIMLLANLVRLRGAYCTHEKSHKDDRNTGIYGSWKSMKTRCSPTHFQKQYYFEKGIGVCDEWAKSFKKFKEWALSVGYREGLQIDRINNAKGYYPQNCRFVTQEENLANRDMTIKIIYNEVNTPLMDAIRSAGKIADSETICNRIRRGWVPQKAIDTPVRIGNYHKGQSKKNNQGL